MINDRFFNKVQNLKNKHTRNVEYNIFRTLRVELDEVRLHSRLLYDLLNPRGNHSYQDTFLKLFLKHFSKDLQLDNFSIKAASADLEYKNIDILIRCENTAIVIENKINAEDQPKQLYNYYTRMQEAGYEEIKLVYLTLEGRPPSRKSIDGLSAKVKDEIILLSYKEDIYQWIKLCQKAAKKDKALRGICNQYLNTIGRITNKVENPKHMSDLKELLKKHDNLENVPDLIEAFNSIKVELQLDLWKSIFTAIEDEFGKFYPELKNRKQSDTVQFKENFPHARNNWIKMKIPQYEHCYLFLLFKDNAIIYGIECEKGTRSKNYKEIAERKAQVPKCFSTDTMPVAKNAEPTFNFRQLSAENLQQLKAKRFRQKYADNIAEGFIEMITELKLPLPKRKSFIEKLFSKEAEVA